MGSPHLTEKEKKRIQQLRDEGLTHEEIAKKVNRSASAVGRALTGSRSPPRGLRDAEKEKAPEVRRLLDAGATYKQIKAATGLQYSSIADIKKNRAPMSAGGKGTLALPTITETSPAIDDEFRAALSGWMERNGVESVRRMDDGRLAITVRKEILL